MWLIVALSSVLLQLGIGANVSTPLQNNSWAFLVAGSKGFNNYRHQADICHAYHVMLAEGVPASQIIVMMYDDIAFHKDNPTPGVIINRPNGNNVYQGVKIDYKGKDVNAENFLNVLTGNKRAMRGVGTGRVIQSDENTNLFVYFNDHGGPGVLCFPTDVLSAVRLEQALRKMNERKRYNKLIMYIEACYSGSMFDNILEENTNVFVMTAAARDESSFGAYCDYGICLGNEFSVKWMEHMDSAHKGSFETFFHQYQHIRTSVKQSHVQIYGDFSIGSFAMTPNHKTGQRLLEEDHEEGLYINSKRAPIHTLKFKIAKSNETSIKKKSQRDLHVLLKGRRIVDAMMERLVSEATADQPQLRSTVSKTRMGLSKQVFPCYMELLKEFQTHCFGLEHEYLIHQYHKLANICVLRLDTSKLLGKLGRLCSPYKRAVSSPVL